MARTAVEDFDSVYDRHHRTVYAFLFGKAADKETAADLLQDTFVRVWTHVETLRAMPDDRRLFWILRIAGNLARDHRRRETVRCRPSLSACPGARYPEGDPQRHVELSQSMEDMDRAIRTLPDHLRTALVLSVMTGLSSAQIGRIVGYPAGTVRYHISEARKRIAAAVGLEPEEST